MADQDLEIWAKKLISDSLAGNAQRRLLNPEEFLEGWGRLFGVSTQQLNQLFFLLTSYSPPTETAPYLHFSSKALPSTALVCDGQVVSESDSPVLYNTYGGNLPDLTSDAPTGFTYIVRNH